MAIVPYDQQAISFVNRVWNAVDRGWQSAAIYDTVGMTSLAAALWFEGSKAMDGSDNMDEAFSRWPVLDRIYSEIVVKLSSWDPPHSIWETYDKISDIVNPYLNKQWLAMCVINALIVLDGSVAIIWMDESATTKANDEFKNDDIQMGETIRQMWHEYADAATTPPDIEREIEFWLNQTDDEIREIMAQRRAYDIS